MYQVIIFILVIIIIVMAVKLEKYAAQVRNHRDEAIKLAAFLRLIKDDMMKKEKNLWEKHTAIVDIIEEHCGRIGLVAFVSSSLREFTFINKNLLDKMENIMARYDAKYGFLYSEALAKQNGTYIKRGRPVRYERIS